MVVIVESLVIDVRADVVINMLTGRVIPVSISYFLYVLSGVVVDMVVGALTDVIMDFVSGIGVEVLPDANGNAFTSLTIVLEFVAPKP